MDVEKSEEYKQWTNGNSDSTKYHKKKALKMFCELHDMNPSELIKEGRQEPEEGSDKPWLEEKKPDQRLLEYHEHLTGKKDYSKTSAQTYWRWIKSFYGNFGVEITKDTPKAPKKENQQPEYTSTDVKKMTDGCRNPRDRAIILTSFQGGMDPAEICRLNYGHVKQGLGSDRFLKIHKVREKSQVEHDTWLMKDAIEALETYLGERKKKEGEPADDDPLFVSKFSRNGNSRRMTPNHIQRIVRDLYDRIGNQVEEAQVNTKYCPFSLKYLRKAFGVACDNAGVSEKFKDYWMGHRAKFGNAYGGTPSKERQKEELKKLEPYLSITTTKEETTKNVQELKKRNRELEKRIGEQSKAIEELREEMEKQKELMRLFGNLLEEKPELKKKFQEMI